jgi:hypothetical protein
MKPHSESERVELEKQIEEETLHLISLVNQAWSEIKEQLRQAQWIGRYPAATSVVVGALTYFALKALFPANKSAQTLPIEKGEKEAA